MTKQTLVKELENLLDKVKQHNEVFAVKAACKLVELIQYVIDDGDRELNRIHGNATFQLLKYEISKLNKKFSTSKHKIKS